MSEATTRKCSTCRYAQPGAAGLECRRFPPARLQGAVYVEGQTGRGVFARVEPDSWCGEHRFSSQGAAGPASA